MQKRNLFLSLVLVLSAQLFASVEQKKSFVIPAKPIKESTNTLKEHLGDSVQKTLKQITALQKQTALLLEKLSETQQKLLKAGSSMLKNKEPFKKASKESLVQAENTINALHTHFHEGMRMVNIIIDQTEKNSLDRADCFSIKKKI
jgi:hypothetical protein